MSAVRLDSPTDVVITPDAPLSIRHRVFSSFAYERQGCYLAEQKPIALGSGSALAELAEKWERIRFCVQEANRLDKGEQTPPADRILMNQFRAVARRLTGYDK